MPIVPFLPAIIGAAGGVLGGIGASKSKTSTYNQNQTSTTTGNQTGAQSKVDETLFRQIIKALKLGANVSESDRNAARGQINENFALGNDNLISSLVSRGFGDSGKVASGLRSNETTRQKAFQSTEATLRNQAQTRFMDLLHTALAYITPRSTTTTGSASGSQTQPGQSPWSAIGSGLGDLSSYLFLRQMGGLGGAGAGGGDFDFGGDPSLCHIARALYGETSWEALVVRSALLERARRSVLWAGVVGVYRLTGRHIARLIRWNRPARLVCRFAFDRLLAQAINV